MLLKREDVHELGSFKWRGALPMLGWYRDQGATRLVTSSTGNHGAAAAWAAGKVGLEMIVFVPEGASDRKLELLRAWGATVRVEGVDLDATKDVARDYSKAAGAPFFEDGAERLQYTGYESIADEIIDQLGSPPGTVIVPVGNGALLAGVGTGLARRSAMTHRVGAVPKEAPVMALSVAAGEAIECDRCNTFADGLSVRVAIPQAVEALTTASDELVLVSERAIAVAIGRYAGAGLRVEGAGAASLAALDQLRSPGPVVVIVTGGNIDDDLHGRAVNDPTTFPP